METNRGMTANQDDPSVRRGGLADCDVPNDPSWAHVSGWSQLSGSLRKVTCAILSADGSACLSARLPELSDTLTECGYPWEVVIVHAGSDEPTRQVLSWWGEIPGFWSVSLPDDAPASTALTIALEAARGDAVVLMGSLAAAPMHLLSPAIIQWESGSPLVYAVPERDGELEALAWWDLMERMNGRGAPLDVASGKFDLALFDRRLVNLLLG